MRTSELELYKSLGVKQLYRPMKHSFFLKNSPDKNDLCPLYINISHNGERRKIHADIKLSKKNWDSENRKVINHPQSSDYNLLLEQINSRITQIKIDFRLKNETLTLDKMQNLLINKAPLLYFYAFYQHVKNDRDISESTLNKHNAIFEKLNKFHPKLTFADLSIKLFEKFRKWCRVNEGNAVTTINSNVGVLKKYLYIAKDNGIYLDFDIDKIPVGSTGGRIVYLNFDELKKFYNYYYSDFIPPHLKLSLGYFLFSCNTGLRISDVFSFNREDVSVDVLELMPYKTRVYKITVTIKINQKCRDIINHCPELFIEKKAEKDINLNLKDIAKSCGIRKNITHHVARHTFATHLILKDVNARKVQKLMGHKKIETTMKYVHITQSDAADSVDVLN